MGEVLIDSKTKLKTEVLKASDFDEKYRITIEKIISGQYEKYYIVRSYTKRLFGYKLNSLAADKVESDYEHEFIESYQYKAHDLLDFAVTWARWIKQHKYPKWKKYQ